MSNFMRSDTGEPLPDRGTLGQGGQGRVWRTETHGQIMAVKTYFPQTGTPRMRQNIQTLIARPSPHVTFVWPKALVENPSTGEFGYLMDFAGPPFVSTEAFLGRGVTPTFRTLTVVGRNLADSFLKLHADGLCYRDISSGNVRFDPQSGDVRIIDNDNVTIEGDQDPSIGGTPSFMAPEIVRGEALPSADTDRYSLAVLLFLFMMSGHPLDGRREAALQVMNMAAMKQLYGVAPVYIFDPNDTSNRPDPAVHRSPIAYEPIYPESIKKLFLESFTKGLTYPSQRVKESLWCDAFEDASDLIFDCQHCKKQNFYKAEIQAAGRSQTCWKCGVALAIPARLRVRRKSGTARVIALGVNAQVFGRHIGSSANRDKAIGIVKEHPHDRSRRGLQNLTQSVWNLTLPDGGLHDIPNGRSVPLIAGYKINFGAVTGEIEV